MSDEIEIRGERRKPLKVGTVTTVDMATGEVVETRRNAMTLMPTKDGTCPECGVDHESGQPHNRDSLVYQMRFHATHGRWPEWRDAMRHCSPEVQAAWREQLIKVMREKGLAIPDDLLGPGPAAR